MKITTEECLRQMREVEYGPELFEPNPKAAAMMAPLIQDWVRRFRVYELGCRLRYVEVDDTECAGIGAELMELSGICNECHGEGVVGDPPDAAGVGGGMMPCPKCKFVIKSFLGKSPGLNTEITYQPNENPS